MSNPIHLEIDLNSEPGQHLLAGIEAAHGRAIVMVAKQFTRLFLLRSPWAPGLRIVGAETSSPNATPLASVDDKLSLFGSGSSIEDAFAACIGEGIERLSQFEREGDLATIAPAQNVIGELLPGLETLLSDLALARPSPQTPLAWIEGRSLADGQGVLVPADWCLRREPADAKLKLRTALSTGAAAGPSYNIAASRALLELVERHCTHLWWEAGRRAAPFAIDSELVSAAAQLIGEYRQQESNRATWLLDLTTDLGIPTVAAVSFDNNGTGFACGTAARLNLYEAAAAAIRELCQLELGLLFATVKLQEAGPAALNETDKSHLRRGSEINASTCALVHPLGRPVVHRDRGSSDILAELRATFAANGIDAALVDLTRSQFGLPVVHALAPRLCPMPAFAPCTMTRAASDRYGGGERWNKKVPLS